MIQNYKVKARFILSAFILGMIVFGCAPKVEIQNPYEGVDWQSFNQYKANLHTHTTRSDGRMSPQDVVDSYQKLGYKILALTDHNEVTFPWTSFADMKASEGSEKRVERGDIGPEALVYENRDPEQMEMLAIQGNEVSSPHHIGSYFSDYQKQPGEEKETLNEIGEKNGLVLLNHPGRYTGKNPEKYNVDWYVDIFNSYNYVTGMEVYNQGDRYSNDRELWDAVLAKTMPERSVWGYSNDDFHVGEERLGRNWNVFLMPELSEVALKEAMIGGHFFYVYAVNGHNGPKVPAVKTVNVDHKKGIISIDVTGQDSVRWISAGQVISRGETIKLTEYPDVSNYVRAEIYGPESIIGMQPFGIKTQE